jgi:hypothetical protein
MKIALVCTCLFFCPLPSSAQHSGDSLRPLTRLAYAGAAVGAMSLVDYIAFGLNDHKAPFPYRPIQALVQTAIFYLLYELCDLKTALVFGTLAWTWNLDLAFYGWANLLNPAWNGRWENRSHNGLLNSEITWAGWTPIGLLRPPETPIARDAIIAQSLVGISLSVALAW